MGKVKNQLLSKDIYEVLDARLEESMTEVDREMNSTYRVLKLHAITILVLAIGIFIGSFI